MIFGALHLLGFSFAPRIKALKHQQLYGFRKRREYTQQSYELLPDGYIKTSLIEPNGTRCYASLPPSS